MTISTSPAAPVALDDVTVTASTATGDVVCIEITSVPPTSSVATAIVKLPGDATVYGAADVVSKKRNALSFTPDVAGEYGVTVYDFRYVPEMAHTETRYDLIGSESGTVHIGETLDLPIVTTKGDGATLRIVVVDETVTGASLVDATTERARLAALQSSVTVPLAALVSLTVGAMGTDLVTGVNDLYDAFNRHRVFTSGSVHAAADTTNSIDTSDADVQESAIKVLNATRAAILGHLEDSTGATTPWHTDDDLKNYPLTAPANSVATAIVLSADLRERVYERHRLQISSPNTHGSSGDATNPLATSPSALDDVIVALLDAINDSDPTAPTGESEGAQDAQTLYGFTR